MTKKNNVLCPVCSSRNTALFFTSGYNQQKLRTTVLFDKNACFSYFKCKKCEAEFIANPPKHDEFREVYDTVYTDDEKELSSARKQNSVIFSLLRKWRKELTKNKLPLYLKVLLYPLLFTFPRTSLECFRFFGSRPIKVLDIGCGNGDFLNTMKNNFNVEDALGVDISPAAVELCKKNNIRATTLPLSSITFHPNLVTAAHLLEHIDNPREFIQQINSILEKNGFLIMSLPNTGGLGRRLFGKYWHGFSIPRHLVNYNKKTIEELLKNTSLKIVSYRTRGIYLSSLNVIFQKRIIPAPLTFIFHVFQMLPGLFIFNLGDEQIVVAKKI